MDEQRRSVLDYSAKNFLSGGWNNTQFMSPNIQDVDFDALNPSAQFPGNMKDGFWVVPANPFETHDLGHEFANHTGVTMEMWQMHEVRANEITFSGERNADNLHILLQRYCQFMFFAIQSVTSSYTVVLNVRSFACWQLKEVS